MAVFIFFSARFSVKKHGMILTLNARKAPTAFKDKSVAGNMRAMPVKKESCVLRAECFFISSQSVFNGTKLINTRNLLFLFCFEWSDFEL